MELRFEKYEGLGNDFVLLEGAVGGLEPGLAARLCDRHLGVGADGVLLVGVGAGGRPYMRVINADGSEPEMCGNGLRCAALHLVSRGLVAGPELVVDTGAGPHPVRVLGPSRVEVQMRPASLEPGDLPLVSGHPWVDERVEVAGRALRLTAVSMGNPHAVTFDPVERALVGPALQADPRFPERVNVGFATPAEGGLELEVFERGAGWTRACGTGACAAAVAAVETGRAPRGEELRVALPGGDLRIRVGGRREPIRMTGPARHVFSGRVRL